MPPQNPNLGWFRDSCATSAATTRTSSRLRRRGGSAGAAALRGPFTPRISRSPIRRQANPPSLPGGSLYGSQLVQIPVAIGWWIAGSAADSPTQAAVGRDLLRAQLSVVELDLRHQVRGRTHAAQRRTARVPVGSCINVVRDRHGAAGTLRLEGRHPGIRRGRLYGSLSGSPTTSTGRATWCSERRSGWPAAERSRFMCDTQRCQQRPRCCRAASA